MKTVIAWIEYSSPSKASIYTYEYATYGKGGADYPTVKEFLNALRTLAKSSGYSLEIKNVVIG